MNDDKTVERLEAWGPAKDFEGIYEVSDCGRVRRVAPSARQGAGRGGGARIGRVLAQQVGKKDHYRRVTLWKLGRCHCRLVHVMVAHAFIGPCPDGKEVNHADGNKANNRATNLEYMTHAENCAHAYATGLRSPAVVPTGEAHHCAKLTEAQVREVRQLYVPNVFGVPRIAKQFGLDTKTVRHIVQRKTWKEVA